MFIRPDPPPPFVQTERDLDVLAAVERHGYLTADHIKLLCFRSSSSRALQRRLRVLWANKFLNRHFLQWVLTGEPDGRTAGRRPLYLLGARGRDDLAVLGRLTGHSPMAGPKSQMSVGRLEHDLVVTDFLVRLEADAGTNVTGVMREPALWRCLRASRGPDWNDHTGGLVSDGSFTLAGGWQPLSFHIEVVHALPRGGNKTLATRMRQYAQLNRKAYFKKVCGQESLRAVIFLTTSPERASNLQKLAASLPYAKRLFWFGHFTQVFRAGVPETDLLTQNILELPFVDGNGDVQRLADQLGAGDSPSTPTPFVS